MTCVAKVLSFFPSDPFSQQARGTASTDVHTALTSIEAARRAHGIGLVSQVRSADSDRVGRLYLVIYLATRGLLEDGDRIERLVYCLLSWSVVVDATCGGQRVDWEAVLLSRSHNVYVYTVLGQGGTVALCGREHQ